eukprot:TRINITY_DN890_c0_g1_i1.p1 TRINITY_DN890_c0_g1~~TRINITY_DN890_c0_g1_i1.p1  ORF type:complete len:424 (-),score=76.75 TRINITY_DN890_c0_g1_i1:423-1694(-)
MKPLISLLILGICLITSVAAQSSCVNEVASLFDRVQTISLITRAPKSYTTYLNTIESSFLKDKSLSTCWITESVFCQNRETIFKALFDSIKSVKDDLSATMRAARYAQATAIYFIQKCSPPSILRQKKIESNPITESDFVKSWCPNIVEIYETLSGVTSSADALSYIKEVRSLFTYAKDAKCLRFGAQPALAVIERLYNQAVQSTSNAAFLDEVQAFIAFLGTELIRFSGIDQRPKDECEAQFSVLQSYATTSYTFAELRGSLAINKINSCMRQSPECKYFLSELPRQIAESKIDELRKSLRYFAFQCHSFSFYSLVGSASKVRCTDFIRVLVGSLGKAVGIESDQERTSVLRDNASVVEDTLICLTAHETRVSKLCPDVGKAFKQNYERVLSSTASKKDDIRSLIGELQIVEEECKSVQGQL